MLNLSDITLHYIENTFLPIVRDDIYTSFMLMESFGIKYYEDRYIDIISLENTISSDDKADSFILALKDDVIGIIEEHGIEIDREVDVYLNELNEIVHFLYIIQNLEDYELVSYRLNAEDTPKNIITDLISRYSLLKKERCMELLLNVKKSLVEALKAFIDDNRDTSEAIESNYLKNVRRFFSFIENTDCLGLRLFNDGYVNLTLEEIVNILPTDISEHIDKVILTNRAQAALDVLSLLIIGKDTYQLPLLEFKKYNSYFTSKLENVTKLDHILLKLVTDFNMFLEVENQKEQVDA